MSKEVTNELILEEIRRNRQELKAAIEAAEVRVLMKIEEQNKRIKEIEEKYADLADKIEIIQRKEKENNIIIFGLKKKPEDINIVFITAEIKKLLDVDVSEIDLNNLYALGKGENCPVKVEFTSYLKKASVLRNVKKLKGTNISIVNDLTTKQRQESKILRKHLYLAKQNKSNSCYIRKNKLYVNNRSYTAEELEQLEDTEDTDDENFMSQPRSAPATPTHLNVKTHPIQQQTQQIILKSKPKTSSSTPESSSKEKRELKDSSKKTGKDTKEDKVITRSKK